MKIILLILVLSGCATQQALDEEHAYREGVDASLEARIYRLEHIHNPTDSNVLDAVDAIKELNERERYRNMAYQGKYDNGEKIK